MSTTKTETVILEDGNIERRTITSDLLDIGEQVAETLAANVSRRALNLFEIPDWGAVHGVFTPNDNFYTIELPHLPLKTHFKISDGVLYPKFSAKEEPVIAMKWTPPEGMLLKLLCAVKSNIGNCERGKQWLVAYDGAKHAYRLPLGNLFDTCELCAGDMDSSFATVQEAIKANLDQLVLGQWQGDLDNKPEETQALFRFKPNKEGFEQLPSLGTWQENSLKVSQAIFNHIVL
jgi:hypothetical protein